MGDGKEDEWRKGRWVTKIKMSDGKEDEW
jgi:hypothetical protein